VSRHILLPKRWKGLTLTELGQLALDLRKHDRDYQQIYSQAVQQIGDRFYEAGQRFIDGLARFPREKKPHKYRSLVYPQKGWEILRVREIRVRSKKNKKKLILLRLSSLGVFKVIVHKDFPLNKVKRVVVKLMPSEERYISRSWLRTMISISSLVQAGLLLLMLGLRGS
jgi:putative transposase